MPLRPKYSVITNLTLSNFAHLFRPQFNRSGNECQLPSRFKLNVKNAHQLQQQSWSKSLTKWQDCLINEVM